MAPILLLLFLLPTHLVSTSNGSDVRYVGTDASSCESFSPCETLQYYASNQNEYFTNASSFKFLPGTHILNGSIHIYNATDVTLTAFNTSEVSVIECTGYTSGIIFERASNISLASLSFANCSQILPMQLHREGETARATLAFGEVENVRLEFVSVFDSKGYGLLGHCVYGSVIITNSTFSRNHGTPQHLGGNAAMEYVNCLNPNYYYTIGSTLYISHSNFTNGYYTGFEYTAYTGTLATGLSIILSHTNVTVQLSNSVIQGNINRRTFRGFGGNLFIHFFGPASTIFSNRVQIRDCALRYGSALYGAGIALSVSSVSSIRPGERCENSLSILNTDISYNEGVWGSGLNIIHAISVDSECPRLNIVVVNSTFESNALVLPEDNTISSYLGNGVAVHMASNHPNRKANVTSSASFHSYFEACNFTSSQFYYSNSSLTSVGMAFATANQGNVHFRDCNFLSNSFTALGAYRAEITVSGSLTIMDNRGINGGGLVLCQSSFIVLTQNAKVSLIRNHAVKFGGAIYVESECLRSKPHCFYQFDQSTLRCNNNRLSQYAQFYMLNNTAGQAGNHIYGGALDNCYINRCRSSRVFHALFHYNNESFSAIASDPRKICFCSEGIPDCEKGTLNYNTTKVYPGSGIDVYAVVVGQFDGTVPGTIVTYSQSLNQQHSFFTEKGCTVLNIPLLTTNTETITVNLNLNNVSYLNEPRRISVLIEPCPVGFGIAHNMCVCDQRLQAHNVQCDIKLQHIRRVPPAWIGFINDTDNRGIIFHNVCPYRYCRDDVTLIASSSNDLDQDSQCAPNRTGLLCSKCEDGFGISLGSFDCLMCERKVAVPLFVFGFLLIGILLVIFLVAFNVTYSEGYFSGLLFYANVVDVNSYVFFQPQLQYNILQLVISWINLASGFSFCLYSGMDVYAKLWLSFCFPVYLFIISGVIVVLCRKSKRMSQIFGGNIIKVLATLFQLSYTSLLQSVVVALAFTQIQYPQDSQNTTVQDSRLVWLADPSLEYFQGKHIPLGLTAVLFGLAILAYTLILLFIQPLQRYSHLRCFSRAAKLKPLIDTYTAPHIIQDECRYWEGLLLLFRLLMSIIFTANVQGRRDINLVTISTASLLILTLAWSVNGVYKKWQLKVLNAISFLNLAALSVLTSQNYSPPYSSIVTNTSFGVEVFLLLAILLYIIVMKIKHWCPFTCKKQRQPTLFDVSDDYMAFRYIPLQQVATKPTQPPV